MNVDPFPDDVALLGPDAPPARQIEDLIRHLVTIHHRFGNTTVTFNIKWGANALWGVSADKQQVARLEEAIKTIDQMLRIPAAEYVPAISDVFTLIDGLGLKHEVPSASEPT